MEGQFILSDYIAAALTQAVYEQLEDNTYASRIPACKGVVAFGPTRKECEEELQSVLEDWVLAGLKMSHSLPIIDQIN